MSGGARGKAAQPEAGKRSRGKLPLIAGALVLLLGGGAGGAWYLGLLPGFDSGSAGHDAAGASARVPAKPPVFVEVPDIVANLNTPGRRQTFVKLRARVEVADESQAKIVQAAMPRLLDLFGSYLRETRPEEIRGSAGTQRLREEIVTRSNLAIAPAKISDVLFVELVMQ
ncbi:flagellar basal body-associated FliL family protein [Roseomonas sp. SSH11]|uniref:Flagellar protein FliL n=1 Tax=Pararoseomonas baculiformis TaxID=2820812 RepID=A0ABS4AKC7_9PROT|nr:flagellar basal body-associated FliL family protein [Pararoseomonas baculiformis]MBP0447466.1 flagellar basal body-associated FliL family protein [Pararoseomonas baculiformis]